MANPGVWSPKSTTVPTGQIKIGNVPTGKSMQVDWVKLNTNSANQAVKNLEYRVNDLNVVEFRYPTTTDPNGPKTTATSIQDIADDKLYVASFGYTPQTTKLIQDSLQRNLSSQAQSINWKPTGSQTSPNADQQGPPLNTSTELSAVQLQIAGDAGLRYPKLMKKEQDKIKFVACEIKPTGSLEDIPSYTKVDGPVCLAIQSPISDQNSVDWGPDTVNAIEAKIFGLSYGLMQQNTAKEAGNLLQGEIDKFTESVRRNGELLQKYLAGQAASLNNVLARTDNIVLNPNLELLFQGPQLRPFTFQFKMSARNQGEANEIKAIIKYFKYHMAVRKTKGIFLKAPHVFTIQYMKGETENHPGINIISPGDEKKACALTNCSVDYTPLGSYMTFNDGTMVSYTLSLQFQELTPIYDTDYNDYPHEIGF